MRQNIRNDNWAEVMVNVPPVSSTYDATANDSDKSFVAPNNKLWKLCHAHVTLVTSAAVGNRQITIAILDASGNVIIDLAAGAVQAASTTRHYAFIQGIYRETAFVVNELQCPLPIDAFIPPGGSLRLYDSSAIDPTADDMTVSFQYMDFTI